MLFNKNGNGDDEIGRLASWTAGHEFQYLEEAITLSQDWLQFVIGEDVVKALTAFYESTDFDTPTTEAHQHKKNAVTLTQRALLNRAYKRLAPKAAVQIDNTGIFVKWGEDTRPAKEELPTLLKSLENDAFAFLNMLIRHMNAYPALFPEWTNGTAKKKADGLLIRSAYEFSELYNIDNSESYYFYIIDKQRRTQQEKVQPAVGKFWHDLMLYHNNKNDFSSYGEATSTDGLPPSGDTKLWLLTEPREFWKWDGSQWERHCQDVRKMYRTAQELIAEHTIYLKIQSDVAELRESPVGTVARIESYLKSIQHMATHQKTAAESLTAELVAMREAFEAAPVIETEEAPISTNTYIPTSTGNSFML